MTKYYIAIVEGVKRWIDEHPDRHMTMSELAGLVHCGTTMLHRAFKQHYKITLYAYQLKQRLEKARKMIDEDYDELKTIARKTGFKTLSHFSNAFKKEFGMRPKEYRNQIKN